MGDVLLQATIYLAACVIAVPVAKRIGLGSVLGYIIAGAIIGEANLLLGMRAEDLHRYAEFGVVLLLFVIGLEIEPRTLWQMRNKLVGLGGLQIGTTTVIIAAGGNLLGLAWPTSFALGLAFSLSSTAIVLQTLTEKGLSQTEGGRSSLSVLLTQDLVFIPMLIIIPLLVVTSATGDAGAGHHGASSSDENIEIARQFIAHLPPWGSALLTFACIAFIVGAGYVANRPFFRFVNRSGLLEITTAATLLVVISAALLMTVVGLSPALGTFLAGVMLANSEFKHEIESNIAPFKSLFLGLFFVTIGSSINFTFLFWNFFTIIGLTVVIIVLKLAVLYPVARIFALRGRDLWLFTLGLAQAGEFTIVLIQFMQQTGVIDGQLSDTLLMVTTLSMVLTPALFMAYDHLARRYGSATGTMDEEIGEPQSVIIAGVGRFGHVTNEMIMANGFKTVVLDNNIETINLMRKLGVTAYLGDPSRPELLEAAGLPTADILVVAVDDPATITKIVAHARKRRPDLFIVSRASNREHVYKLYQAGASEIIRETFDASLRAGRYVIQKLGIPEDEAHNRTRGFYRFNRRATRELASLWDPEIPIHQNADYIKRMRELSASIDIGLGSTLEDIQPFTDGLEAPQNKPATPSEKKVIIDVEPSGPVTETEQSGEDKTQTAEGNQKA